MPTVANLRQRGTDLFLGGGVKMNLQNCQIFFLVLERSRTPPPPQRHHSALIWFALQCSKAKQCTVRCGSDHMPVSRGYMRAQYLLLMARLCVVSLLPMKMGVQRCPNGSGGFHWTALLFLTPDPGTMGKAVFSPVKSRIFSNFLSPCRQNARIRWGVQRWHNKDRKGN